MLQALLVAENQRRRILSASSSNIHIVPPVSCRDKLPARSVWPDHLILIKQSNDSILNLAYIKPLSFAKRNI
ncbi:MAG: hypothetical protein FWC21_04075 [Treponema sp.]|nr:hypothetical protein [Treponema sp.]